MAFQRDLFTSYLLANNNHSANVYCSVLKSVEELFSVSIDDEYEYDRCEELFGRLQKKRQAEQNNTNSRKLIANYISKLKKYCLFKGECNQAATEVTEKRIPAARNSGASSFSRSESSPFYISNKMTPTLEDLIVTVNTLEEFESKFSEEFLNDDDHIGNYLRELLVKYDKKDSTVSKDAWLDHSYVGHIVNGKKKNPSRDALISICFAIGTTVDELQYLLKYAGQAPLYVRRTRDVIIWFGFMKGTDLETVDNQLRKRNLLPLIKRL